MWYIYVSVTNKVRILKTIFHKMLCLPIWVNSRARFFEILRSWADTAQPPSPTKKRNHQNMSVKHSQCIHPIDNQVCKSNTCDEGKIHCIIYVLQTDTLKYVSNVCLFVCLIDCICLYLVITLCSLCIHNY